MQSGRPVLGLSLLVFTMSLCHVSQLALAGSPGPVPEGKYNCHKISGGSLIHLADLEIKGNTYRFFDDEPFAPFQIDKAGTITWSKGVGFLPEGWTLGKCSYEGNDQFGRPMIKINYTSASGAAEVVDCVKEK